MFDQCLGVEKKSVKDMIHLNYIRILWTRPIKRIQAPRVMKFKVVVDS